MDDSGGSLRSAGCLLQFTSDIGLEWEAGAGFELFVLRVSPCAAVCGLLLVLSYILLTGASTYFSGLAQTPSLCHTTNFTHK